LNARHPFDALNKAELTTVGFVVHRVGGRHVPEKRHGSEELYPAPLGSQKL
jgi:hypothetical protein